MIGSDSGKGPGSVKSDSPEAPEWPCYNLSADAKNADASEDADLMLFRLGSDLDDSGSNSPGMQFSIEGMDLEGPTSSGSSLRDGVIPDALGLEYPTACTQELGSTAPGYSCHTRASSFGTSEPELYTSYLGPTFHAEMQGHTNFSAPGPMGENFPLAYADPTASSFGQLPRMGSPLADPASSLDMFGTDAQNGDAESQWSPESNASLLHFAVAGGNIETLRLLLKYKPHLIGVRDVDGYTPIQRAIMVRRTDMVALFLEHGDVF